MTSKIKHQNLVKMDTEYTIRCKIYMIKAMAVLIWSETDQNTHFLNKMNKTLKKTRARRQTNRDFKYRAARRPRSSRLACSKALEKIMNSTGTTGAEMKSIQFCAFYFKIVFHYF